LCVQWGAILQKWLWQHEIRAHLRSCPISVDFLKQWKCSKSDQVLKVTFLCTAASVFDKTCVAITSRL
jgi:hypothetical protein